LGNGTTTNSSTPVLVNGITTAINISTGQGAHACAVLQNGTVMCWGSNTFGQLGTGFVVGSIDPNLYSSTPLQVTGVTNATKVTVGLAHSCAVLTTGAVKCWGYTQQGLLGDGTPTDPNATAWTSLPVQVTEVTNATSISANANYTCATLSSGSLKCWGQELSGEFGDGSLASIAITPVTIPNISNADSISLGYTYMCYHSTANKGYCMGSNASGQLGTTPSYMSSSPNPYLLGGSYAISAGSNHTCIISALAPNPTKVVLCVGGNAVGQLGNGTTTDSYNGTSPVVGITNPTSISAGSLSTCAILNTGSLQCWGQNTGNTTNLSSTTPVTVVGF
jgi:alpha-tubulin suppressor-like RCC1 family protein